MAYRKALYYAPSFLLFISMISQPPLVGMNSNLYYLLMTPVYFINIVTWMYLPPILTTSSTTWLKANKLSINVKKTKLMIFRPRQKTLPINRQIIIENSVLKQVDNTKFLGVYTDQHVTWKTHVNFIAAKISKYVGLLYKAKYYLPSKSLLTLYYALVYPYLTYCNLIWAPTYVTNLQRIYLLQKRAVRRSLRLTTRLQVNLFLQI